MTPDELVARLLGDAVVLRRNGVADRAEFLERLAAEIEAAFRSSETAVLTLSQASMCSGYSADHLGRLVRNGKLPNAGTRNRPRIRRADLPRRPGRMALPSPEGYDPLADARALAGRRKETR